LVSKSKAEEKWQNKISIMNLMTIILQDELSVVIDEYLDELYSNGNLFISLRNLDNEGENAKESEEMQVDSEQLPKKNLSMDDFISSSTVLQYFAKKYNSYLNDRTFLVRKEAKEIGNFILIIVFSGKNRK